MGADVAARVGRRPGYDAVVIGGGPAGTAAAATLARDGRSVLLVVGQRARRSAGLGEGAPPGLDQVVDDVFGAGTFVAADHLRSIGNRSAWGEPDLVGTDFMFHPFGTGWHLDRRAFDARLLAAAIAAGVTVTAAAHAVAPSGSRAVVDATGRRAAYARRHGAQHVADDRLVAVTTTYALAPGDRDATTTVVAVADGWWYSAPIPGGRRVVAFFTDGDLLVPVLRSAVGFDRAARLVEVLAPLLPEAAPARPVVVAAGTAHLEPIVGDGWLAVGDAAACFDPISSQGMLTAVLMGREVARCLERPDAYVSRYRSIVDGYDAERRATYRRERRWPASPFWARRAD